MLAVAPSGIAPGGATDSANESKLGTAGGPDRTVPISRMPRLRYSSGHRPEVPNGRTPTWQYGSLLSRRFHNPMVNPACSEDGREGGEDGPHDREAPAATRYRKITKRVTRGTHGSHGGRVSLHPNFTGSKLNQPSLPTSRLSHQPCVRRRPDGTPLSLRSMERLPSAGESQRPTLERPVVRER